jgi:hypothetical protein
MSVNISADESLLLGWNRFGQYLLLCPGCLHAEQVMIRLFAGRPNFRFLADVGVGGGGIKMASSSFCTDCGIETTDESLSLT